MHVGEGPGEGFATVLSGFDLLGAAQVQRSPRPELTVTRERMALKLVSSSSPLSVLQESA